MKNINWLFLIFPLLQVNCSPSQQSKFSQGLIALTSTNASSSFIKGGEKNTKDGYEIEELFWYNGSAVIFEEKSLDNYINGNDVKGEVSICNYTYVDLKAKRCFVFGNFSDTAKPVYSYVLTSKSSPGWNFLALEDENYSMHDTFYFLPDTIINGKNVKRLNFQNRVPPNDWNYTVYASKDFPSIPHFKINPFIDSLISPYNFIGSYFKTNDVDRYTQHQFEIVRSELSAKEKLIFKKWGEFVADSNCPIVDKLEGRKRFGICLYK